MKIRRLLPVSASLLAITSLGAGTPIPGPPENLLATNAVVKSDDSANVVSPVSVLITPDAAPTRPWSDKASLSFVATSGNAKGNSLGFGNEFLYKWIQSQLAFNVGGVRIETTTVTHSATGLSTQPGGYVLNETETSQVSSESYFALGRYDYKFTEHFFAFGSVGWESNKPAGLDSRTKAIAGVGILWFDTSETKFRTDVGVGFTKEQPVFSTPDFEQSYGTWQVSAKLDQKFGSTTHFTSEAAFSNSMKDSRDYLGVWKNSLITKISDYLALKVGYDFTYKNKPASSAVNVISSLNSNVIIGQVPVLLKKTDTMFTTSLVITF